MPCSGRPDHQPLRLAQGAPNEMESSSLYQYDDLEGNNDIRLIVLYPESSDSRVRFKFAICDLENPPDYEALSYTWADEDGDQSLTSTVRCDPGDQMVMVTRNCENALRRLRLQAEPRFLWVDAICINQAFVQERNRQVAMMAKIYHSASRVVVYIGEAAPGTDEFLDFLERGLIDVENCPEKFHRAARSIFSRRWFRRLWILQEIALARAASILWGNRAFRWQILAKHYQSTSSRTHRLSDMPHLKLVFECGLKGARPATTLPDLFIESHQQACSEPRDRVFALLGIVTKARSPEMMPEYGATNRKIFTNLAIFFLREYKLLFVDRYATRPSNSNLTQAHLSDPFGPWDSLPSKDEPNERASGPFDSTPRHQLPCYPWNDWSSWVFDWTQPGKRPGYPVSVDNLISVYESENGVDVLEILGQRVLNGSVCPLPAGGDNIAVHDGVLFDAGIAVSDVIVAEISQDIVLLWQNGDHYVLIGGIADFERCYGSYFEDYEWGKRPPLSRDMVHKGPGQCTPSCFRQHIQLGTPELFSII